MLFANIKKLLKYAMLEPDQFEKVQPLVASENTFALKLSAVVQILYYGVSLISSLGLEKMSDKKLAYGIGTLVPLVVLIIDLLLSKKHPTLLPWLVRCFCAGLFATGLLCTLFCTPDELTILLLIFFFCVPMIFIFRPIELILLVLLTDIVYFSIAPVAKTPEVLTMDMIDMGIFSTLSLVLGVTHMHGQYRRYWLETEAVDLAEVRYHAAFIDQLTEAYNRNAYNRDTEGLDTKALPSDFMLIALDINGLKAANDTFGHIAGDELIKGAADCMKQYFKDYGTVYRVGGDEFTMILNAKGTPEGELLDGFNQAIAAWHGVLNQKLSVSYGVVIGKEVKGMTIHEIELLADKRMYQAKSDYYKNAGIDRRKH